MTMAPPRQHPGPPAPAAPAAIVTRTRALVAGRRRRSAAMGLAAAAAAALVALVLADALVALPDAWRVPALPALGAATLLGLIAALGLRRGPDPAAATRLAEAACGDHERRLSAALDLAGRPGELAAAGAARFASAVDGTRLAAGLPPGRARRWATGLAVVGAAALLLHLAVPGLFAAVWPRLWDPRGDHPPWSRSGLAWATAPATVRSGAAARFEVDVSGPARELALVARDGRGRAVSVPMFLIGERRYAGELAGVVEPLTVWAEGGGTRTRRHALGVDPVPVFGPLDLELEAPAYARLAPEARRIAPGEQAEFAALPGSVLRLRPSANRPLAALLVGRDDGEAERLPLVDGALRLPALPGSYRLAPEAVDGARGAAVAALTIVARSDQPPRAQIVQPSRDTLATPSMRLPLVLAADDDLGLVAVHRPRAYNGLEAPELQDAAHDRAWRRESALDLAALGVRPGDVLTFAALARDTRPEAQWSPTVERHVRIISEAEYNQRLRARLGPDALERKYRDLVRELRALEADADRLAAAKPGRTALDAELAELGRRAGALAAKSRALKRPDPLFAIEPELQEAIAAAAEELAAAAAAGDLGRRRPGAIGEMLRQDLALLTSMARAEGLLARLRQLIDAEQNATDRLGAFAEHRRLTDTDRVRLRELADQEAQIADALQQWLELVPQVAEDLRSMAADEGAEPAARQQGGAAADQLEAFAREVAATGAGALKRHAAASARAGDGVEAHRQAAEARDRLLALLPGASSCQGSCRSLGLSLGWCSGKALADCLAGLGVAAGNGYGLGGAGRAGMGVALGYGGDDQGGSEPSLAMDLLGPENLGDSLGQVGDRGQGGIAAIAASGAGASQAPAAYRRGIRRTAAAARTTLDRDEQRVVDDYFRRLEDR